MFLNSKQIRLAFFLLVVSIVAGTDIYASEKSKNILVINSYHQGYVWTDSLTSGIIRESKLHPEITIYIENLNSKQFGQTHFRTINQYLHDKYIYTHFDGVLVTDNDALDFAFQYKQYLFPDVPVVFAGIPNPEDYRLDGSDYWGYKETANSDSIIDLVRSLLPESRRLLVITDRTTTGNIYRESLAKQQSHFHDFSILFPEEIDVDSISSMVSSSNGFDAIFYLGINQDKLGAQVDEVLFLEKIGKLAKVPLFSNDMAFIGKGVIGGFYQSATEQGTEATKLLIRIMNSTSRESFRKIYKTDQRYFFDRTLLDKFNISVNKLPQGATIVNRPSIFSRTNFNALLSILILLSIATVVLSVVNRKRRNQQLRSNSQLREIETQKKQLEEAYKQLSGVISELESTNERLNETNNNLLEAKKKAEESDNLKSAFLANVSHEIRTPLNSIVGFSSLLSDLDLDGETRNLYIELIESNTESLLVLIDEIIDLSKIEAQQLTLKKQNFCIDALMDELFQIFNRGHKNKAVELKIGRTSLNEELFVFSDRVRVKQVFVNLLTNALKFTDSGFVEMGYSLSENKEIVLYVKDTGIGISKEYHQAIFHRFRKLNENSAKIYRGTGLGLAITQKLVELLAGESGSNRN